MEGWLRLRQIRRPRIRLRLSAIETEESPNLYLGPELNLDRNFDLPRSLSLSLPGLIKEPPDLFRRCAADKEFALR